MSADLGVMVSSVNGMSSWHFSLSLLLFFYQGLQLGAVWTGQCFVYEENSNAVEQQLLTLPVTATSSRSLPSSSRNILGRRDSTPSHFVSGVLITVCTLQCTVLY